MIKSFSSKHKIILFLGFFLFTLFFLQDSLSSYFSQDDFYHLRQIMHLKIQDLPMVFIPKYSPEQTFYRPVSRELYNFVMFNIFGLNSIPFHIVNLFLIFLNCFLTFKVVKKITQNELTGIISSTIYLLSAVHSTELYYLASVQTLFSTILILTSLMSYLNFLQTKLKKFWLLSILLFLLAVGSHESSIVLLGFIAIFELFTLYPKKGFRIPNNLIRIVYNLFPFGIIVAVRLLIHFFVLGLPDQEVYRPIFSLLTTLNTITWFTLWNFGFPEMMTDFVTLKLSVNPNLFKWYGQYIQILIINFSIMIGLIIFSILKFKDKIIKSKAIMIFVFYYLLSVLPFLFFPQHKFVYYLSLPSVWFSSILGFIFSELIQSKSLRLSLLAILFILLFGFLSFETTKINKITYWAAKRARAAEFIINDISKKHPKVKTGTTFVFLKDPRYPKISNEWGSSSKQAFFILSGSDALQVLYGNQTIKVLYEDVNKLNIDKKNIIYKSTFPF